MKNLKNSIRNPASALIAAMISVVGLASPVAAASPSSDFGIDDDTEYQSFVDAIRRAEYIRDDFIAGAIAIYDESGNVTGEVANPPGTKPSVIGTIAATVAFMERNPAAESAATEDFIEAFEAELESFRADDPYLNRPSNFLAAMRAARVTAEISASPSTNLGGFDTDINERALELLGISFPEVTSRSAFDDRVEAHERALVRSLGNSSELVLLLTHVLMNQDPDGSERVTDNTDTLRDYIRDDAGYESAWKQGMYPKPEINAAIIALPADYDAYQAAVAQSINTYDAALATYQAAEDALRDPTTGKITDYDALETALEQYRASTSLSDNEFQQRLRQASYGVHDAIDEISLEIGPDPLSLDETLGLTEAQLEAIALERRNDLREVSGERASISANAILMYQNVANAEYAERQLNLGAATLGANKNWTNAKAGTQLGMNVLGFGVAILDDDVTSAYGFFSDSVMTSLDLAENNESSGVTLDDVYIQIREVQHQIQAMQTQLNERFDIVEQKLDIVFDTMVEGFDVLAFGQQEIRTRIDQAIDLIQRRSSELSTLEGTLIRVNTDLIDLLFSQDLNDRVGVRFDGVDFPFNSGGGGDDFDSAASDFYTYAVNNADDAIYAGDPANVTADITAYLAAADENFTDSTSSSRINELIALSPAFLTGGSPILVPESVVSPEAWSMASTAYLQLASENPWYFARDYTGQGASRLDEMIAKGNDLIALAQAFRQTETDNGEEVPTLFKELVTNYKAKVAELQAHIDDSIERYLMLDNTVGPEIFDVPLSNGTHAIDPWLGNISVDSGPLVDAIEFYLPGRDHWNTLNGLPSPSGNQDWNEGYNSILGSISRSGTVGDHDLSKTYSLLDAATNGGNYRNAYWILSNDDGFDNRVNFYVELERTAGNYVNNGNWEARRRIQIRRQTRLCDPITGNCGSWSNDGLGTLNQLGGWADFMERMWPEFKHDLAPGSKISSGTVVGRGTYIGNTEERAIVEADQIELQNADQVRDKAHKALGTAREALRTAIYTDMLTPGINTYQGKSLVERLDALDDAEAILDAYVAVAFPNALERSGLLRSALRGAAPLRDINGDIIVAGSEVGLRGADVIEFVEQAFESDAESDIDLQNTNPDIHRIDDFFNDRIDLVYGELIAALDTPVQAAPYAEMVLAELKTLRERRNDLAVPDIYESQIEGAVQSVLDNDTRQVRIYDENGVPEYRTIEIDMSFTSGDDGYLEPANGTLQMFADGTFVYIPDDGFTGTDYFTYRARCNVAAEGENANYATSAPVMVRVRTLDCPLDLVDQGDDLGSEINAFDIRQYIGERTSAPSISGIIDAAIAGDCQ